MPQNDIQSPAIVAVDFETAGYYRHSACAIGLARIENLEITNTYYSLIRPPSSKVYFTNIHGLCWDDLKDERNFKKVWPEIADFIGDAQYLLAHNAPFDRGVLYACCNAYSLIMPSQPFMCTLRGSRIGLKNLTSRNLNAVCEYFDIELNHHHACSDALACAQIYLKLRKLGLNDSDLLLQNK